MANTSVIFWWCVSCPHPIPHSFPPALSAMTFSLVLLIAGWRRSQSWSVAALWLGLQQQEKQKYHPINHSLKKKKREKIMRAMTLQYTQRLKIKNNNEHTNACTVAHTCTHAHMHSHTQMQAHTHIVFNPFRTWHCCWEYDMLQYLHAQHNYEMSKTVFILVVMFDRIHAKLQM